MKQITKNSDVKEEKRSDKTTMKANKTKKYESKPEWRGYTMDELAYHKALTLARIEMAKERLDYDVDHIKKGNVFLSGSWFGRIMKMLDYSDFIVIALTVWRKLAPVFSKKRK